MALRRRREPVALTPERGVNMANTDDAKGRIKEAAGSLTDDQDLKNEGKADRASGAIKEKVGEAKDKVDDAIDAIKDKLHKD